MPVVVVLEPLAFIGDEDCCGGCCWGEAAGAGTGAGIGGGAGAAGLFLLLPPLALLPGVLAWPCSADTSGEEEGASMTGGGTASRYFYTTNRQEDKVISDSKLKSPT